MIISYSNAQMRRADEQTIKNGTSSLLLMERAGEALARAVLQAMQRLGIGDVLFVCGGGNNGGDGFVAARILCESGEEAAVLCLADRFSEDCKAVKSLYHGAFFGRIPRRRYALIVDCLFGTGLTRAPADQEKMLVDYINSSGAYVIACDLPSGIRDCGIAYDPCVAADETLSMGAMKNSLLLSDGADLAGKISVADIGISFSESGAQVYEDSDIAQFYPKKKSNTHKGMYGSAAIIAGTSAVGAAFLSTEACLKTGAGYTRFYVPCNYYLVSIGKLPACVLKEFVLDDELFACESIAIGMGAGVSEMLYETLSRLLRGYRGVLVLDADALNVLARYGTDILKEKTCKVVLTPHPKEFARLTGKSVEEILLDPLRYAREFASRFGVTVLLKNNRSVITDGERIAINVTGSPVLAKGGSGDVLSGFLAGTAARGIPPFEASCVAAYICGKAGEKAASEMGEYAPDATDVIAYLPNVMCDIAN